MVHHVNHMLHTLSPLHSRSCFHLPFLYFIQIFSIKPSRSIHSTCPSHAQTTSLHCSSLSLTHPSAHHTFPRFVICPFDPTGSTTSIVQKARFHSSFILCPSICVPASLPHVSVRQGNHTYCSIPDCCIQQVFSSVYGFIQLIYQTPILAYYTASINCFDTFHLQIPLGFTI